MGLVKETSLIPKGEAEFVGYSYEYKDETKLLKGAKREAVDGLIRKFMHDIADKAEFALIKYIPEAEFVPEFTKTTGALKRSVRQTRVDKTGNFWTVNVGLIPIAGADLRSGKDEGYAKGGRESPEYGKFVEHGTGRYGPTGVDITPTHGNVLAFRVNDGVIITQRVKGQKPQHFSEKAERDVARYMKGRKKVLAEEIKRALET